MKVYWLKCIIKGEIWIKHLVAPNVFILAKQLCKLDPEIQILTKLTEDNYE